MIIVGGSRRPGNWRDLAWLLMPFALAVLVLDALTFARVLAFESHPPAVVHATGRVRNQPAEHRRNAQLWIEASQGWVDLVTGPANLFGSSQAAAGSTQLDNGSPATVAWLDAPASLFHDTLHYPIHVEQNGHVLFSVDGAAGVAAAERGDLLTEAVVVGILGVLLPAMSLFVAHRRDLRRRGAESVALRKRRLRSGSRTRR